LKCFLVCHVLLPIKEVRGGQVGWGSTSPNKRCLNHPWKKPRLQVRSTAAL
jgi:hypothetical protein